MKKAFNIVTTVLLVFVFLLAFLLIGIRMFGFTPYTVLSGSMEPNISVGSLVYVRKASVSDLAVNDSVTFKTEEGVIVTHRIIEVHIDEYDPTSVSYTLKGDANDTPDPTPVPFERVIGKVSFSIPLLGYLSYYVHTPVGRAVCFSCMALLLLAFFLPDIVLGFIDVKKGSDDPTLESCDGEAANARDGEPLATADGEAQTDHLPDDSTKG